MSIFAIKQLKKFSFMKKIFLLATLALLAMACKTQSVTPTKLDRKSQADIKGNWTITAVEYPGKDLFKVNSFGIADSQCFVGSTWKFISNNNKGDINITAPNCAAFSSPITWFINRENQFVLKVLSAGEKAKKVRDGYVLTVASQNETTFQLIDKINVGNKPTDVTYTFTKN
ncbi:MAG: hypothetical protein RLZZ312_1949 [Bacteroidota bacterium]|jgi:hypothetical protein